MANCPPRLITVQHTQPDSVPIIRFDTVTKEFSPESFALKDVSFDVDSGELVFITGPSGSGKTTLMRLLTKEYSPTSGEIFFHEEPLSVIKMGKVHQHRRKIGVVFQDYRLVPEMNIWENIALPLYVSGKKQHEIEQRVTDLLNLIKLPEKAEQFPSQLSGGEAQRVSIARALAVGPEIIFADEPTGNLDPETSRAIAKLLRKINELGTTILIATHDVEVLGQHNDLRQLRLEKGLLVEDKPAAKVGVSKKVAETESKAASKTETSQKPNSETKEEESEALPIIEETTVELVIAPKKERQSLLAKIFGKKKKVDSDSSEPEIDEEIKEKPKQSGSANESEPAQSIEKKKIPDKEVKEKKTSKKPAESEKTK